MNILANCNNIEDHTNSYPKGIPGTFLIPLVGGSPSTSICISSTLLIFSGCNDSKKNNKINDIGIIQVRYG